MKKTLVALAALAATSAFAQVTITGNLDFAGAQVSGTQLGSNGTTFNTTTGTSSTSAINISAIEDLGGGMKAQVFYGLDPRTLANDSYTATFASSSSTKNVITGLNRHEMYVGVSGSFGNVRLGSINSVGLGVQGDSSPLGTAAGSGYSIASGSMMNSIVQTRFNRSVRYDTPTMSGFTASVLYAPGNDELAITTSSNVTGNQIPNNRATTEIGLKYVNGPLTASVAQIKQDAQVNATGYFAAAQATAVQQLATSATILGVNYKLDNTTLYYGMNTGDRLAAASAADGTNVQSKGSRIAIKQTMGQIDLMASMTKQKTTGVAAADSLINVGDATGKVTGFTGLYNLSKTAATYIAYEKYDSGITATAGTGGALASITGARKVVSIGLRKSF